jgi:hypothetical protein
VKEKQSYRALIPKKRELRQSERRQRNIHYIELHPFAGLNQLTSEELEKIYKKHDTNLNKRLVAATKMATETLTASIEQARTPASAYEKLGEALSFVSKFQKDANYTKIVQSVEKDILENPVSPSDMLGLSAQLSIVGAGITGNTEFLDLGIAYLDYGIGLGQQAQDSTVKPNLQLEKMKAKVIRGDPIDLQEQKKVLVESGLDFKENPLKFYQFLSEYAAEQQKLIGRRTSEKWKDDMDRVPQPFQQKVSEGLALMKTALPRR